MTTLRCTLSIQGFSQEQAGVGEGLCAGQTAVVVTPLQRSPFPHRPLAGSSAGRSCHNKNPSVHPLVGKEGTSTRQQHEKPSCRIQFTWLGPRLHQRARGKNDEWRWLWTPGQCHTALNVCTHQHAQPQQKPGSPPAGAKAQVRNLKLSGWV